MPGGVGRGLGGSVLAEPDPNGLVAAGLLGVYHGSQHLAVSFGRLTA